MCGDVVERQILFNADGSLPKRLKPLSENEKKILKLLSFEYTQTRIAAVMHLSRPRINQLIKRLESQNLIQRVQNNPPREGIREYNYFYTLSIRAKGIIAGKDEEKFIETPARAHHFKRKFHIIQQFTSVSQDRRTGYSKSWKMRGGDRHKFWYSNTIGGLSVTIDVHPGTLVAYLDKGQKIIARTVEEAEQIGWHAIYKARDLFMEAQANFGAFLVIEETGQQIGNIHYGYLMHDSDPMVKEVMAQGGVVGHADYHVDKSPEKEMGPGWCEAETERKGNATRLAEGIRVIESVPELVTMPAAMVEMNAKLDPLTSNTTQIMAMLQGSITQQQMIENFTKLVSGLMSEIHDMRKENAEMRMKLGLI